MMGATDIVLRWGDGNALTQIPGTLEVDDLAPEESRTVYVSHAGTELALAEAPAFSLEAGDVEGLTLTIIARGKDDDGVYRTTDGKGFLLKIEVAADAVGADKDRGDVGPDWDIHWTRRGVLL